MEANGLGRLHRRHGRGEIH